MIIDNFVINKNSEPFLIAEIGVNHNGNMSNAIKLINFAKLAGFHAVKFQTYITEMILSKNTPLVNYQKNSLFSNMNSLLKKFELSFNQFLYLKNYCKKKNIIFLSTPFDIKSAKFLHSIKIPAFKISSTDNDNFLLLKEIKKTNKPIILSTGMTTELEIKKTIKFLNLKKDKLTILHCISDYPTKLENIHLKYFYTLQKFGYYVGFSDHTIGAAASSVMVSHGAKIVEKHITLDKKMTGPDHNSSLEAKELKNFVDTVKKIYLGTKPIKRTITKDEASTKSIAKKSLYFSRNLKKNHLILEKDIIALRPYNNGIPPSEFKKILGKKILRNVKKFEIININHVKKKI